VRGIRLQYCSGDNVYFACNAVRILTGIDRKPQAHLQQGKVRRCRAEHATKHARQVCGVGEPGPIGRARDAGAVQQVTGRPLEPEPETATSGAGTHAISPSMCSGESGTHVASRVDEPDQERAAARVHLMSGVGPHPDSTISSPWLRPGATYQE